MFACYLPLLLLSSQVHATESIIATLPGPVIGDLVVSPNHKHVICAVRLSPGAGDTGGWCVYVDGNPIGRYDGRLPILPIPETRTPGVGVQFSNDGNHYGYLATRGGKEIAVVDGKEGPAYEHIERFALSPGGYGYAYAVQDSGSEFLVRNGKEVARGLVYPILFSPNGRHLGYGIDSHVFLDGQAVEEPWRQRDPGHGYRIATSFKFSPDSRHFAYIDSREDGDHVIEDRADVGTFFRAASLSFSPDGKRLGFDAERDCMRHAVLIENGRKTESDLAMQWTDYPNFRWSPDSKHYWSIFGRTPLSYVSHDGVESPGYKSLFSHMGWMLEDGRFCYCTSDVMDGTGWTTHIGNELIPGMRLLDITPDGKHRATSSSGEYEKAPVIWVDGNRYDPAPRELMLHFFSGPKGKHFVDGSWEMPKKEDRYLRIDGVLQPKPGAAIFSPDENHLAIVTSDSASVDGVEVVQPGCSLPVLFFDGATAFHGFAVRKDHLVRIEGTI